MLRVAPNEYIIDHIGRFKVTENNVSSMQSIMEKQLGGSLEILQW